MGFTLALLHRLVATEKSADEADIQAAEDAAIAQAPEAIRPKFEAQIKAKRIARWAQGASAAEKRRAGWIDPSQNAPA
jgi:hypothetical protein